MKYICIDTNIYINFLVGLKSTNGLLNESEFSEKMYKQIFWNLKLLSNADKIKIIVPEIIELELEKHNKIKTQLIKDSCISLKDCITKTVNSSEKKYWSDLKPISNHLIIDLESKTKNVVDNWEKIYASLRRFFISDSVIRVPFDQEIFLKTQKRIISGEISQSNSNDSYIIDSIYKFVDNNQKNNKLEIYLVTENIKDFFKKDRVDGKFYEIKDHFRNEICEIKGLYSLNYFNNELETDYSGFDPYILDKDDKFFKSLENDSEKDRLYVEKVEEANQKYLESKIIEIQQKRNDSKTPIEEAKLELLSDIDNILSRSRSLESWDDRSEYNLLSWLSPISESEIPLCTFRQLLKLKMQLTKYYQIHSNI